MPRYCSAQEIAPPHQPGSWLRLCRSRDRAGPKCPGWSSTPRLRPGQPAQLPRFREPESCVPPCSRLGPRRSGAVVLRWTTPTRHLHLHQPMTPRRGRHLGAPHWQSAAPNSNRPDSAWVDQGCMKPPKASRNLCPLRDTRLESKGRLASVPSRRRTLQGQARRRPPTADRQRQEPSRVTASRLSSGRQWSRYHAPLGGPRRAMPKTASASFGRIAAGVIKSMAEAAASVLIFHTWCRLGCARCWHTRSVTRVRTL